MIEVCLDIILCTVTTARSHQFVEISIQGFVKSVWVSTQFGISHI